MFRFALSLALAAALGCSAVPPTREDDAPLSGSWGGAHIAAIFTDSGATFEYDCAHGGIAAPVRPVGGRFEVPGFHVREHGGPVRDNERPDTAPARFLGVTRGDRLTLRAVVGADTLGPFELRRGSQPRILRCL